MYRVVSRPAVQRPTDPTPERAGSGGSEVNDESERVATKGGGMHDLMVAKDVRIRPLQGLGHLRSTQCQEVSGDWGLDAVGGLALCEALLATRPSA